MPQQEKECIRAVAPPVRREIDLVRFEIEELGSGMYRHRKTKFVFELSRPGAVTSGARAVPPREPS